MKRYGVTYWHLNHQVTGVEACHEHNAWLIHDKLPDRPHIKPLLLPAYSTIAEQSSEISFQFAKFTKQFLNDISESNSSFNQSELIAELSERGYILGNKRFKRQELTSDLFEFIKGLERTSATLLPYSDKDYRYLSYLLTGNVSQHPFKYLLVLFWLEHMKENRTQPLITKPERKTYPENKSGLCKQLLKQSLSMEEVSRISGKSRCYIKSVAIKNNIPIELKPKVITDDVISAVKLMAYKGFHRRVIAKELKISTGSVEQIISWEDGLVEKRKLFKHQSKRRRYKAIILRAMRDNPSAIKQEIKNCCYAAFHWLYAHEKSWLNSTLPLPTKSKVRLKVVGKSEISS